LSRPLDGARVADLRAFKNRVLKAPFLILAVTAELLTACPDTFWRN
jgi:hypothetical protein